MKSRLIQKAIFPAAVAALSASLLSAQTQRQGAQGAAGAREQAPQERRASASAGQTQGEKATAHRSSSLVNSRLTTSRGESLGTIDDIAIDLDSGRAVFLVVNVGSPLNIEHKAIPPSAVKVERRNDTVLLDLTREKWEGAPTFDSEDSIASADDSRISEIYSYYGQQWMRPEGQQAQAGASGEKKIRFTQDLFGDEVETADNQNAGRLVDVFIDLESNAAPFLVVAQENPQAGRIEFTDAFIVPTVAFERIEDNAIVVGVPESAFTNPTDTNDVGWVNLSEEAVGYPSQPDWGFRGPREVSVLRYSPGAAPGGTFAGREQQQQSGRSGDLTARVKQALAQETSISPNQVRVTTEEATITLRGQVETEQQKQQIERRVRQVDGVQSVENEIEVRGNR